MSVNRGDHSKELWVQLLYMSEWAKEAEVRAQAYPGEPAEWLAHIRAAYSHAVPASDQPAPEREAG